MARSHSYQTLAAIRMEISLLRLCHSDHGTRDMSLFGVFGVGVYNPMHIVDPQHRKYAEVGTNGTYTGVISGTQKRRANINYISTHEYCEGKKPTRCYGFPANICHTISPAVVFLISH